MIEVIIPAAGASARFKRRTSVPKGLIKFQWHDRVATMIEHVWGGEEGLIFGRPIVAARFTEFMPFYTVLRSKYDLISLEQTRGQADTVRVAIEAVDLHNEFLVINCDNGFKNVVSLARRFVAACRSGGLEVGAVVFDDPYRSGNYGYVDDTPLFEFAYEKGTRYRDALAGMFYFESREIFLEAFNACSEKGGELYISSVMNHVPGVKTAFEILRSTLHEWGTPEDLERDPTVSNIQWENVNVDDRNECC